MNLNKLQKIYNALLLSMILCIAFFNTNNSHAVVLSKDMNIAVVDVAGFQQTLLSEVTQKIQGEFAKKQEEVQGLVNELKDKQAKFQKDRPVMSEESIKSQEKTLLEMQTGLQNKALQYEQEFKQRQQEEINIRTNILMTAVNKISNDNKYDVVIAKNVFLFVKDKFDITEDVKKQYDIEFKKVFDVKK